MTKYPPYQIDHGSTDPSTWILPEGAITRIGRGGIQDTTFSPDGKHLTIATYLGLWWYDVQKRELITLWEKGNTVSSVAFSASGEWIATSWGGPIRICEVTTGECIIELPREERIPSTEIVFSPNREYLAVGGYSRHYNKNKEKKLYCCVEVWKLPKNQYEIGTTDLPKRVGIYVGKNPLAFSPDNRLLAFASPDGTPEPYNKNGYPVIEEKGWVLSSDKVVVLEIASGRHLTTLSGIEDIGSICFSPCGKQLAACGGRKGHTQVWDIPGTTDQQEWQLHSTYQKPNEEGWQSISYTPDNRLFSTFYHFKDDTFSVQDLENSETLYRHPNEAGFFNTEFSSGVHHAFESEYSFHYWKSGANRSVSLEHSSGVWPISLLFSLDGNTLYAQTGHWGILSYDITQPNNPPQIFKPRNIRHDPDSFGERYKSIEMSQQGKLYATSGDEKDVRLWEYGIDTPIVAFPTESEASDVIFSPITNLLACHDEDNRIYIWDITTNEIYDTFTVESDDYSQYISFSPDGKYLIYHYGQIYDVSERKLLDRYSYDDGINFQAFSAEETQIWCDWNDDTLDLWDFLKDEEVLSIPKPEWWDAKHLESLAVSSCGKYMACSPDTWDCNDNLCVWDITKGKDPIAKFTTQDSPKCLKFSHDNTILASCYYDGSILLWDLKPYL